jgi:hypothetical protein
MRKRFKFGNKPTYVGSRRFPSKKEARRYRELKLLDGRPDGILDLQLQVPFDLVVNGQKICRYLADFVYTDVRPGLAKPRRVVEDCKGVRTPVYKLKAKLMKAIHGIEILET